MESKPYRARLYQTATAFSLSAFCILLSALSLQAAPNLTIGSTSGQAGTSVTIPVTLDPTGVSIAALQFSLTLPPGVSTGPVTIGSIANGILLSSNSVVSGKWNFVMYGAGGTVTSSGTLLTLQFNIAAATAVGTLALPVSNV